MKFLLINPYWKKKKGSIWNEVSGCVIPHGLAVIAACLEKAGVEVRVLDTSAEVLTPGQLKEFIASGNYDYIGITATTFIITDALAIARICRETSPEAKIIFGGVHPTIFPEEVLSNDFVDLVVRGEGEEAVTDLLSKKPEEIPGLSYKKDGKVFHNPVRPFVKDLDSLPMPAYHLFPVEKYHPALGGYRRLPSISMITSRGCPGQCTFCYKDMFGRTVRSRSPESLYAEILLLKKNYGIKEIVFYDDTFTVYKDRVLAFCELLIREKADISWSCMSRIDFINGEMLTAMKKAGCHQICYGVESGDETILKNIKKPLSFKRTEEVCALTRKAGMSLRLSFMLGNPGETEASMQKTIQLALRLDPDIVQFNITTPYPGSAMFDWAKEKGYLNTYNWQDYDLSHMVMDLPTVDRATVEKYYSMAYKKFYLRPRYILRRALKTLTPSELLLNGKALLRIASMLRSRE